MPMVDGQNPWLAVAGFAAKETRNIINRLGRVAAPPAFLLFGLTLPAILGAS